MKRGRHSARALGESEERYHLLAESLPLGIITCDSSGNIITFNQKVIDLVGLAPDNFTQSVNLLTNPSLADAGISGDVAACMSSGQPVVNERHYVTCKGEKKLIRYNLMPLRNYEGSVTGVQGVFEDVTERRRAEEALGSSEAKFRTLFEHAGVAIFLIDIANGNVIDCNSHAEKLVGHTRDEITRMKVTELHPPEDAGDQSRIIQRSARCGYIVNLEAEALHKDGRRIPVILNATLLEINGRNVMMGLFTDITERKRSEEALRRSEEQFRALAETAPVAICILQDGHFKYINPAMETISGYAKEELQSIDFRDIVHPDMREYIKSRWSGWLAGAHGEARSEFKGIKKNGDVRWIDLSRKTISYGGKPALLLTGIDITERKQAETALKESEEKFRVLAETTHAGIVLYRGERLIYVNPVLEKISGYSSEELLQKRFWDLVHPDHQDMVRSHGMARQDGLPIPPHYEAKIVTRDGEERWMEFSAGMIHYKGEPTGIATLYDITEHKRAEATLQFERSQLLRIFDSIDESIYISDPYTYEILYANKELKALIGKDLIGGKCYRELQKRDAPCDYCTNPIILNDKDKPYCWEFHNPGIGRDLWIVDRIIKWPDGRDVRFEYALDITERKRAESTLAAAKAEMELYVDLMGHDINNMNQISMGFMEMARNKIVSEGKLTMDDVYMVDKAIESVRNSSNLIGNVRKLQREKLGLYEPEVMDLGKMLEAVAAQHGNIHDRQVKINCAVRNGSYVKANELLEDVFINLVGNAIKHSTGQLNVNIRMDPAYIDGHACWEVIVEDDGPGISDGQKKTLFDRLNLPDTRARGKGFGLCLIKLLIDDYMGRFWVEDRVPGDHTKGARFVVMLPAVDYKEH